MTSDGIRTEDWDLIEHYATGIANSSLDGNESFCAELTEAMFDSLARLEAKYGRLPSILATRADYTTDTNLRIRLLEEAYHLAKIHQDRANRTFIASSLVEIFLEDVVDIQSAQKWLDTLADALGAEWDDLEYQQFSRFTMRLQTVRGLDGQP